MASQKSQREQIRAYDRWVGKGYPNVPEPSARKINAGARLKGVSEPFQKSGARTTLTPQPHFFTVASKRIAHTFGVGAYRETELQLDTSTNPSSVSLALHEALNRFSLQASTNYISVGCKGVGANGSDFGRRFKMKRSVDYIDLFNETVSFVDGMSISDNGIVELAVYITEEM